MADLGSPLETARKFGVLVSDHRAAFNIDDLRALAKSRLPRVCFDWLDGGTEDEVTLDRNRTAFNRYAFAPAVMVDVGGRSQQVELFGRIYTSPFGIAPTGGAGLYGYEADISLARAARAAGVPFVLSTASFDPLERVAGEAAGGSLWFQLYMSKNRGTAHKLVQRAFDAGFEALVVTGDVPVVGNREVNRRNGFGIPIKFTPRLLLDGVLHPRWLLGVFLRTLMATGVPRYHNDENSGAASPTDAGGAGKIIDQRAASFQARRDEIDWDDIRWLRDVWPRKLFVKGVLRAADAVKARELGADGVVVSNHGGRQLDGGIASLDALPAVRAAVGADWKVMIDSGFRRGTDIVKALALGADMAFVGRATLYGLAVGGEAGVRHAVDLLAAEIDRTIALLGYRTVDEITNDCLLEMWPGPRALR